MAKSGARETVVFGFVGLNLDAASKDRWSRWRPSIALCQQEDLVVRRFELLHGPKHAKLAGAVCADIASVSPETEARAVLLDVDDPWDFQHMFQALHGLTRRYEFDREREDYLVHITTGTHVAQICLFLLTESRHLPGRLLQTSPPKRRDADPRGTYQVIDLDLSQYDELASRFAVEHSEGVSLLKSGIATRNAAFNRQIELLERVALASDAPILLMGPTGAGKSQLARRINELKRVRALIDGPFVEVNCATLRGDTAMSTLFGHRKGAFTGAVQHREGLLMRADHGLLFLDEIGELGPDEQAMLLGAIEEKRFLPVGADEEVTSEFQLVAGTNRDLELDVAAGRFREDLLARINLWTFRLPGLADRLEDLEPNLDYELDQFAARTGGRAGFSAEARERYLEFSIAETSRWRGNFRDLNASVTRMATLAHGGRITVADVNEETVRLREAWRRVPSDEGSSDDGILEGILGADGALELDRFDRVQLAEVVRCCRGATSLSDAGRRLFAASRRRRRSTNDADRLRKYLARFGLDFAAIAVSRD